MKAQFQTWGRVLFILPFFLWGYFSSYAQHTVNGTVVDATDGVPLPGVNVVVQGTTTGTSTNSEGVYELTVPTLQDTLIFSFIGYQTQIIPVNGRITIDVDMLSQIYSGEELVVVGYGTQEKQQITGSVSSVNEEEFVKGNVNTAEELIQGKIPGLVIASEGGNPNQRLTIRLRGVSTFSANEEPLIVIDGVIGASLENVDPNDIASIDVLKDASASAIYGTRGAAGVIVVTTKRGEPGEFEISYSGSISVIGIENKLNVLSGDQFRKLADITNQSILDLGADTDWIEEVSQTGYNHTQGLALSGGSESTIYRISGNFRSNRGIQRETGFQQITGRVNLTQKALDDKLSVTFNLAATNRESDLGFDNVYRFATNFNPTAPIRSEGFETTGGFTEIAAQFLFNPVAIIKTADNVGERNNFNGSIRANYEFNDLLPGLSASAFYSLQTVSFLNNTFYSKNNKTGGGATQFARGPGLANRFVSDDKTKLFEVTANYLTEINKLRLKSIVGYSFSDFEEEQMAVSGGDFVSDAVRFNNLSFAQDFSQGEGSVSSFSALNRIIGFFGRVSLNWKDTYFINSSYRREASSRFGENEKWGNFWAAGVGVELTNLVEIDFMSQLKLRSSYGVTGNDAPFNGISKLRFAPQGNFFVNGKFVQSFGPVSNANPDLKWEENHEFNIGVDFELLDSRLSGTIEYYKKTTKDLLFEIQVPVPPNLFPTTWKNVGELENKGVDAAINFDIIRKINVDWDTGFIFSAFNNKLTNFVTRDPRFIANAGAPGQNSQMLVRVLEGGPVGQLWGPLFADIAEDGTWRFWDNAERGSKMITENEIGIEDETVLGNGLPDFSLGWTNTLTYKNWSVSTFFRGVFGHQMQNQFRLFFEVPGAISNWNVLESAFNFTELTQSNNEHSSLYVENADFVRLQNANISYNVPLLANSPIRNLSLTLSGNNLFTITGYKGIDPSVDFFDEGGGGSLAPGIERRNNWFTTRSVTFSVDIGF